MLLVLLCVSCSLTSIESNMDSDRYDYSDDDYSEYESEGSEFGESSEEYSDDYSDDYSGGRANQSVFRKLCVFLLLERRRQLLFY